MLGFGFPVFRVWLYNHSMFSGLTLLMISWVYCSYRRYEGDWSACVCWKFNVLMTSQSSFPMLIVIVDLLNNSQCYFFPKKNAGSIIIYNHHQSQWSCIRNHNRSPHNCTMQAMLRCTKSTRASGGLLFSPSDPTPKGLTKLLTWFCQVPLVSARAHGSSEEAPLLTCHPQNASSE